jgi:uncharacterized protein YxjI
MLNRTTWFIREHVGLLKLSGTYDILDSETQKRIGQAREEISGWIKFLRLLISKQFMPATVRVYEGDDEKPSKLVFSIRRGVALFRLKVHVTDAAGTPLGHFQSKFSLGGAFRVFTADNTEIALLKGNWKGRSFRFLSGETELGVIDQKWAGLAKELFTSADNYAIRLNGSPEPSIALLLLAAGLAIDTVLKGRN